jgi:hypothetical protein
MNTRQRESSPINKELARLKKPLEQPRIEKLDSSD